MAIRSPASWSAGSDERSGPEFLFKEMFASETRATYDDTLTAVDGSDLLVSHQLPITAPIVAQRTGIKWVSGILAPLGLMSAHDPPRKCSGTSLHCKVSLWGQTPNRTVR